MIYISIALFSLAASLGVALMVCWLNQKDLKIGEVTPMVELLWQL